MFEHLKKVLVNLKQKIMRSVGLAVFDRCRQLLWTDPGKIWLTDVFQPWELHKERERDILYRLLDKDKRMTGETNEL